MMALMRSCHVSYLAAFILALPLFALKDPVHTANGSVSGIAGNNPEVQVYKSIPFAAPPVGALRWKAPKAAASWEGVRAADQFSPVCEQLPYPAGSIYASAAQPMREDCLYLNVWTAAKSSTEKRPVMVWIHGGALTRGSGSTPTYDGESLAAKGVVLVTINYRLGVFGFLAHPELTRESDRNASGNYGFLDQIAALEWVQNNVAAFGGDPKSVTIFGESAGSWSVNVLVASPLAKGLFQRAIGESGGNFGPMKKLAEVERSGAQFATSVGTGSLQALRDKPAGDLLKAAAAASFPANVDGWFLPQDVYTIFASGKQNDVPVIVGSNADEGTSLTPWPSSGTAASFTDQIKRRFGADAGGVLEIYPAPSDEEAKASHYASFRDITFGWQMRTWARLAAQTGKSKVYLYYFSHVPPGPESSRYGAFHASEIAHVFDNLKLGKRPNQEIDFKLAGMMSSYWTNFAKTGDPNGPGLPNWAAYSQSSDTALEFGDRVKPVANSHQAALDFWDRYFAKLRGTK
ncbi:MAG: carboxylesterase/lipase family protein [Bryobacteraceae bacterium]